MIPVFQAVVDPVLGDCYRAAVASVLDLSLEEIPADIQSGFTMEKFLRRRGLSALYLAEHRLQPKGPECGVSPWDARRLVRFDYAVGATAIAIVPSQMFSDGWHAIVVQFVLQPEGWVEVECIHDPNPGNGPYDMSVTHLRSLTFFIPRTS